MDDQWDGELMNLYKPYEEGTLQLRDLFSSHNEHRIFFTRIMNLSIYILNGNRWDPMLVIRIQSILASLIPVLIVYFLYKNQKIPLSSIIFFAIIGSVPILYENLISGFQNQFYFMQIFLILAISRFNARLSTKDFLLIATFGICAYFSMAGGLLIIFLSALFYCYCYVFVKRKNILMLYAFILLLFTIILYQITNQPEDHKTLKSSSFLEFITSIYTFLDYPRFGIFFIWLPTAFVLLKTIQKNLTTSFHFWFSLSILGFIVVTSFSRGHSLNVYSHNRYFENSIFIIFVLCSCFDIIFKSFKKIKYLNLSIIVSLIIVAVTFNLKALKENKRSQLAVKNYHEYFHLEANKKGSGAIFYSSIKNIDGLVYPSSTVILSFFQDATALKILEKSGLAQ